MGGACVKLSGAGPDSACVPNKTYEEAHGSPDVTVTSSNSASKETSSKKENNSHRDMNIVKKILPPKNKAFIPFLTSSWPGSILHWSEQDIQNFAACFTPHNVKAGEEISTKGQKAFFIVAKGTVEVHAIIPTMRKKTDNIREFLCKKDVGDMVHIPSVRKLITESSAREIFERETEEHKEHIGHKNVLDLIDTVNIVSAQDSTILEINWDAFNEKFPIGADEPGNEFSKLNVNMLRTIMETNLTDYLLSIPIFEGLPYSKLELLSRLCRYSIEKKGSVICREGDVGDEVYILLSGEVKVEAMASKRMVELFEQGVLSPLEPSGTKNISCSESSNSERAEDNCKRKGSVNFQCDYMPDHGKRKVTKGHKTLIRRRQTLLQARHDCQREKAEERCMHSTKNLTTPGTNQDDNGSVARRLSRLDIPDPSHSVELARFGPGEYFGEMATFVELPRAATVTATTNVLMASLSKTSFRTLYHVISPHLEASVEHMVKEHMLQTLLQSKSPFLEVISSEDAKRMAELTTITTFQENTVIFNEGDEADNFCFVYSGRLSVDKKIEQEKGNRTECSESQKRIGWLFAGDYFGEMAVINESKRLATITATTKTVLLEITRENFRKCFEETPELIAELIVRMKGKAVDLESTLNYGKSCRVYEEYLEMVKKSRYLECYNDITFFEGTHKDMTAEDVMKRATCIVEKYLKEGASCQLDLSEKLGEEVSEKVLKFNGDQNGIDSLQVEDSVFSQVKDSVYDIMEKEIFPKFKDSEAFLLLMTQMRAYDDLDVQLLV